MDYLMIILQAVGNVMAGIMLKTIKSCRPGYYNISTPANGLRH
jgi:hypothetical protein